MQCIICSLPSHHKLCHLHEKTHRVCENCTTLFLKRRGISICPNCASTTYTWCTSCGNLLSGSQLVKLVPSHRHGEGTHEVCQECEKKLRPLGVWNVLSEDISHCVVPQDNIFTGAALDKLSAIKLILRDVQLGIDQLSNIKSTVSKKQLFQFAEYFLPVGSPSILILFSIVAGRYSDAARLFLRTKPHIFATDSIALSHTLTAHYRRIPVRTLDNDIYGLIDDMCGGVGIASTGELRGNFKFSTEMDKVFLQGFPPGVALVMAETIPAFFDAVLGAKEATT